MVSFLKILIKAVQKPHYIWFCLWGFGYLWWIDRHLQSLAIDSLRVPPDTDRPLLTETLRRDISRRVAAITWVSQFHPCHPKCLHQSLAIHLWLRRRSIPSELVVGWGNDMGHAWVSYGDQVLNDVPSVVLTTPPFIPIGH